jgi:hypothetical protein
MIRRTAGELAENRSVLILELITEENHKRRAGE